MKLRTAIVLSIAIVMAILWASNVLALESRAPAGQENCIQGPGCYTPTPDPTSTPVPIPTDTPVPTNTTVPTDLPLPSKTPQSGTAVGGPPAKPTRTPLPTEEPVLGTPIQVTQIPTSTPVPAETPVPTATKKTGKYNTPVPTTTAVWIALPNTGLQSRVLPGELDDLEYDRAWWNQIMQYIIVIGLFLLVGLFAVLLAKK